VCSNPVSSCNNWKDIGGQFGIIHKDKITVDWEVGGLNFLESGCFEDREGAERIGIRWGHFFYCCPQENNFII